MSDAARERSRARRVAFISWAGTVLVRALALTWRVRYVNAELRLGFRERKEPVVFMLWHGNLLPLLWSHRDQSISVIISEHSDGEIIARIAMAFGFRTVRGSTSRGAARALLGACREIEAGFNVAVTPDGPRGPRHSVAPGGAIIAQRTGAPMVPVVAFPSRAWTLKSWDRFAIPKPFARLTVVYGEPIYVDAQTPREAVTGGDDVREGIERAMARAASA